VKEDFPKALAGRLAEAAWCVTGARCEELGPAMKSLRLALEDYDEAIMALARKQDKKEKK
jgi:hypothetical protein